MRTVAVALIVLALASTTSSAQDADRLLKAAINTEMVDGNLQSAIEQYRRVAKLGDRPIAAQALVRMAECYQKLGDEQAKGIFEQVLRDYTDQPNAVAVARARLAERAPSAKEMTMRKLWGGPNVSRLECDISPDGRYITCPHWETGDLGVHDVLAGTDRKLTNNNWAGDQFAQFSAISNDGRSVAYAWFNGRTGYELRVMSLVASDPQPRVVVDSDEIEMIIPSDWFPDNETLVAQVFRKDRTAQIALISVRTGSLRVLKTVNWNSAVGMFVSPDGQWIGLDLTPDETKLNERDIFVLATDGSREIHAVSHPGRDQMMGWAPDGGQLLFASDRTSSAGLWAVPIKDGVPNGQARLIKSDIAAGSLGTGKSGALFVVASVGVLNVEIANADFPRGRLSDPRTTVTSSVGSIGSPEWSPDGRYLAFGSVRDDGPRSRAIVIRSVETGVERVLDVALRYLGPLAWSPDGTSFLVKGQDLKGRQGLFRIDSQTGSVIRLPFEPGPCNSMPRWSPDARTIYFASGSNCPGREGSVLMAGDLESGNAREILKTAGLQIVGLSTDGRMFAARRLAGNQTEGVEVVDVLTGARREIFTLREGQSVFMSDVSWSTDNKSLILTVRDKTKQYLMKVALNGDTPITVEVNTGNPIFRGGRLHPNGQLFVYVTGDPKDEVWALENFLPAVGSAK